MLLINRKPQEVIFIKCPDGKIIEVMLTKINGNSAIIGFTAPDDYRIIREDAKNKDQRQCEKLN